MAEIQAVVTELESIPEELRDFYEEQEEGGFRLQVAAKDGVELANTEKLKSALATERTRADKAEKQLKAFADLDPKKAREALKKVEELGDIDPEKESDRLANEKFETAKAQLVERHKAEMEAARSEIDRREGEIDRLTRHSEAVAAIEKNGGNVRLLLPHVLEVTRAVQGEDGKRRIEVMDAKGNARIGDSDGSLMTVEGLVAEMKSSDTFGAAFKGSGQSGSGAPAGPGSGPNTPPAKRQTTKKASEMNVEEKTAFIAEHGNDAWNKKIEGDYASQPGR